MQDTPLETHEKSIKEMKNCLKNWMEPRECLRRVQNELQTVLDLPGWRRPALGWGSSVQLGGHKGHCPQAISGDSAASHSTRGQGDMKQRLLKFRACVVQVEQAGMALW